MKQRFSKRTRLVSALLTLAMVFTFLPFSAFAASYESIENIAFTTNGCDALQIKEGAQVNDWLESFKEKMRNTDISQHPLVAVEGYGFSINMYVNTLGVVKEDGKIPGTFSKGTRYFLELLILPKDGYVFVPGQKFKSVKVNGKEVDYPSCYSYKPESTTGQGVWTRVPLSFKGDHKLKDHPKKLPNCTTPGTESYSECTKCGKLIKEIDGIEKVVNLADLSIPALGHEEDEVNWGWDRTSHYSQCKRCHIRMPGSASIPHFYQSGSHTCTVCGYTWQEITRVKIHVTEPAAGVSTDSAAISNSPELYSATCQWFHNGQEFTGIFKEGETYTLQVTVKSIGMGYKFVKGTEYTINGDSVGRMPMYGVSNEGPWDTVTLSSISFVAKSEAESTEISNIYLTIPAPEAGKTAAEWEDKAQKTDSRYTVKRLYGWCEVDDAGNELGELSTGKFVEGKRYRVYVQLNAKTGYEFPDIANQIAVINGEEIAAVENPYGQNNTTRRNYIVYLTAVSGGSTGGGGTVTPPEPPVTPPEPPVTPPSGGGDGGGAIVIVAAAGAVAAGVVGYGVYNYVSGRKLQALLPEGVAAPENRAQTALLLWNTAGRPEPAEAPAFADVADPDTAKAAQWCVEQGLMKRRLNGKFAPGSSIPAYQVLNAYRKLAGG